jgi:hypothetical protein
VGCGPEPDLSDFASEEDGQIRKIPKPSIMRNRCRRDQLACFDEEVRDPEAVPAAGSEILRPPRDGREVWLHVYDLGHFAGHLNEFVLRKANLGAFHAGVEVIGQEWSFMGFYDAWDNSELTGVVQNAPCQHPSYLFKESIFMGTSPFSEDRIEAIMMEMCERWRANSYHWVSRNCIDFAEELCVAVGAKQQFPAYLRGAIDLGKTPAVFAVADLGWTWFKWLTTRAAEKEAEAEEAARAAEEAQLMQDLQRLRMAKTRLQNAISPEHSGSI